MAPNQHRPPPASPAARLLALAMALALLAPAGARAQQAPPTVTVSEPLRRQVQDWDDYTGRLAPTERVEVRARVGGALAGVHFTDGQLVKTGDLLFSIDPRPYQSAQAEAQGRLAEGRSRVELAQRELSRAVELRRTNAGTEATVDQRADAMRAALASVTIAEAQLMRANLDLEWTRVLAPLDGRISRHLVTPGNLVAGGDAGATLLTTIVSIDPIDLYFDIDQVSYQRYTRLAAQGLRPSSRDTRNPVMMAVSDETEYRYRGVIDFVDNVADPVTGTVRGRARFSNPGAQLTPGIFARLRLLGSSPYEALMLPDSAIGTDQTRKVVFVVGPENRISMREVRLGRIIDGLRVVRDGLKPEDVVVVNGLQRVRAGAPVTPEHKPIEPPPAREASR